MKKKPVKKSKKEVVKKEATSAPIRKRPKRFTYTDCPHCEIQNDARFKLCTDCKQPLYREKKPKPPKNHEEVDWKELQKGDTVYIVCLDVWLSKDGLPIFMGNSGEFKVIRLSSDGILAYSTYFGFSFFNMVWTGTVGETGIRHGTTKVYKRVKKVRRGD